MTILGTHVPVSWWTLIVAATGIALSAGSYRRLATRVGWRRRPTLGLLLGLTVALALTITPDGIGEVPSRCLPDNPRQLVLDTLQGGGGPGGAALNAALFLPLGATAILATRDWRLPAALIMSVPLAIEVAQLGIPGRLCSSSDFVTNVAGGLTGGMACLVGLRLRRARDSRRSRDRAEYRRT